MKIFFKKEISCNKQHIKMNFKASQIDKYNIKKLEFFVVNFRVYLARLKEMIYNENKNLYITKILYPYFP